MFTVLDIVQPQSIQEAYDMLMKRKSNTVIGGSTYLRMGCKKIGTAIELSKLNLNYIKEDEDYIEIGAMTTFRDIEISPILNRYFNGVLTKCVRDIIGVQFRNVVTVGASVFSKYGFSDLLTALLSLDTEVELYNNGRITLEEFLESHYEKDILTKIYIKKNSRKSVYTSMRNSASDYAIVNVAVSKNDNSWNIVVGARPRRASVAINASKYISSEELSDEIVEKTAKIACEELSFGSNMRASGNYRKIISKVLIKRAIEEVIKCK